MREIIHEYQLQNGQEKMTASILRDITGLSISQTSYYLSALNAPEDVRVEIQNGNIRNLDKAALVSGIESVELRKEVLDACVQGSSLKEMRAMISQQKLLTTRSKKTFNKAQTRGRQATKVNMGSTQRAAVVKKIVDCVISQNRYDKYTDVFARVNWDDLKQTTKAFRKLIELLELEMAV